jgi:murein DD-endopeptidase MepM/ murein hydrolase activator NlpD
MRNRIKGFAAVTLGVLCVLSTVAAGVAVFDPEQYNLDRFRDYAEGIDNDTWKDLYGPLIDASGGDYFPAVQSKWQQPRDTGTSPHQGTDVGAPMYTRVLPVWAGWIVYQSGRRPDGTCCVSDVNGAVLWEMVIQLDWNGNGSQDDAVYVKYDHLERVGYYTNGTYVTAADIVAQSGNENTMYGAHLHFGLLYPKEAQTGRWTSINHHYGWVTAWYNGDDLDFISYVSRAADNTVSATAYVMSDGQYQPLSPGSVHLFHRRSGTSSWSSSPMALTSESDRYAIDIDFLGYAPGTQIDWLVRALRTGLDDPHYAGFFPARYAHPNNDPNAVAAAYPFYVSFTQ